MKTLAVLLLCLLPWRVEAQLPHGPDDFPPFHSIQIPPDTAVALTRADIQHMIDSTVAAKIDSALTKHREIRVDTVNWKRYDRDQTGNEHVWFGTRYDTTWVFVRPEVRP